MKRRNTREVMVGSIGVGGVHPIRIQSMTTSDTRDIPATVYQVIRLADAGCEMVRVTVQGNREVEACREIKNILIRKGYTIPLIADIHFYPPAALGVVDFVDKVRINPGNFADKRALFKKAEYDEESYVKELERIEELFAPLVKKCLLLKRAMRIGTNHGSLSDRIMNRYGDSPLGMVESACEFARICRKYDYHDMIFSMKASNPIIMIHAYRLLVEKMNLLGWDYPLHLGVTEAGNGENGRIKSALGIGSLLLDGLGDTIRVSLTEDPWEEIDPCKHLLSLAHKKGRVSSALIRDRGRESWKRRSVYGESMIHQNGAVLLALESSALLRQNFFADIGCEWKEGEWIKGAETVDAILLESVGEESIPVVATLAKIGILVMTRSSFRSTLPVKLLSELDYTPCAVWIQDGSPEEWRALLHHPVRFIIVEMRHSLLHQGRTFFSWMEQEQLELPAFLFVDPTLREEERVFHAAAEVGGLLVDGLGEGIICKAVEGQEQRMRSIAFGILQAARLRFSKTEFIACPGCGRTLFDLQRVTQRIQKKTSHLPGVKIAIMGCIVNGPGEMADADFGYVGSRTGKVDLYVGKKCVEKNIDFTEADEKLIDLIKAHGRWVEA